MQSRTILPWLRRRSTQALIQERDRLRAESDRLIDDAQSLRLTDEQYADLKAKAEAGGPEAMSRFERLARKAGRE